MSHSYRDISREQFARILPVLESARRRTKTVPRRAVPLERVPVANAARGLPHRTC